MLHFAYLFLFLQMHGHATLGYVSDTLALGFLRFIHILILCKELWQMSFSLLSCHRCYEPIFISFRVSLLRILSLNIKYLSSRFPRLNHSIHLIEGWTYSILNRRCLLIPSILLLIWTTATHEWRSYETGLFTLCLCEHWQLCGSYHITLVSLGVCYLQATGGLWLIHLRSLNHRSPSFLTHHLLFPTRRRINHLNIPLDIIIRILILSLRYDAQLLHLQLTRLEDLVHLLGEERRQGLRAVQVVPELVDLQGRELAVLQWLVKYLSFIIWGLRRNLD